MKRITISFQKEYPMVIWEGYSKSIMDSIKDKLKQKTVTIIPTPKVGMFINLESI